MARISIIIPVLNESAGLLEMLLPLQQLRKKGHEILLVDGGSTDACVDIAQPYADRVMSSRRGRAVQMHAGATAAGGSLLWFLHADTRVTPQAVDELLQAYAASGEPCWGWFRIHIDGQHFFLPVVAFLMNLRSRVTGVVTGDQGLFVSRQLYMNSGGFSPLPLMEDIELSKRLRRVRQPVHLRSSLRTSGRRWEAQGIIRTIIQMWALRLAYVCGVSPQLLADWYYPEYKNRP